MTATKDAFFNPVKLSSRDKAATTDATARTIIATDAAAREKKTMKLREMRLKQQAEAAEIPPSPRKKAKKAPAAKGA